MINRIFDFTALALMKGANWAHLTYNEVNIIFYYGIIPLSWCIMFDKLIGRFITTPLFILIWLIILFIERHNFSSWCDKVFSKSQEFLRFFGEYVTSSVVICVLVPLLIYVVLITLLRSLKKKSSGSPLRIL